MKRYYRKNISILTSENFFQQLSHNIFQKKEANEAEAENEARNQYYSATLSDVGNKIISSISHGKLLYCQCYYPSCYHQLSLLNGSAKVWAWFSFETGSRTFPFIEVLWISEIESKSGLGFSICSVALWLSVFWLLAKVNAWFVISSWIWSVDWFELTSTDLSFANSRSYSDLIRRRL